MPRLVSRTRTLQSRARHKIQRRLLSANETAKTHQFPQKSSFDIRGLLLYLLVDCMHVDRSLPKASGGAKREILDESSGRSQLFTMVASTLYAGQHDQEEHHDAEDDYIV